MALLKDSLEGLLDLGWPSISAAERLLSSIADIGVRDAWSMYVNMTLFNTILSMVTFEKYSPITTSHFNLEYDFIVVGAGSGGSAVAGRLSELDCYTTLVLEAGDKPHILTNIPIYPGILEPALKWDYHTVPLEHTGGGLKDRIMSWGAGRVIGGTSILYNMVYMRGNRKDFDGWAKGGATGWSYDEVLPFFKKAEGNQGNRKYLDKGYHGFKGPMLVEDYPYTSLLSETVKKAALRLGYKVLDSNGRNQTGYYRFQTSSRHGERGSTPKAYLVPNDRRPNLHIVKNAFAKRILVEDGRAYGVEFDIGHTTYTVKARKEIIVSCGSVNTAKLLLLSGIGPKEDLEKLGIPLVADLPVGRNFHDHIGAVMGYQLSPLSLTYPLKLLLPTEILNYVVHRKGPWAASQSLNAIMYATEEGQDVDDRPNQQLYFVEAVNLPLAIVLNMKSKVYEKVFFPYELLPSFWCLAEFLHPKSRGTVTLRSADPYDNPLINPNYLAHQDDVKSVVKAMKNCDRIAATKEMKAIGTKPWTTKYPGCEHLYEDKDKYYECQAKQVPMSFFHATGTAKMGSKDDPTTVLDPELKVKGISGLRVADGSVMPDVTSGNTLTPIVMIGEKAAHMIKEAHKKC